MNFLFHMLLSRDDDQILIGNFMGDFVKGRLEDHFPDRIRQGIMLHRRIDSFASRNELFQQSRRRLDPYYGLYRGVMVDLFYDHLLVTEWSNYSEVPLDRYLARSRGVISRQSELLPERLQKLVPYIFEELIPSYGEVSGIGKPLERMSRRVKRANPLAGGEAELVHHYDHLRSDFRRFIAQAEAEVTDLLKVLL